MIFMIFFSYVAKACDAKTRVSPTKSVTVTSWRSVPIIASGLYHNTSDKSMGCGEASVEVEAEGGEVTLYRDLESVSGSDIGHDSDMGLK